VQFRPSRLDENCRRMTSHVCTVAAVPAWPISDVDRFPNGDET
jgi:hypothetical protein